MTRSQLYLLTGVLVSRTGDAFSFLAFILLLLKLSSNNATVSLFMVAHYLPGVLLGAFASGLLDRWPKRVILLWTYLLSALFTALTCVVLESIPGLLVMCTLLGVAYGIYVPCQRAYTSELFEREHLRRANSLIQLSEILAKTIGFLLAGLVFERLGAATSLLLDAASFTSIAVLIALTRPHARRAATSGQASAEGSALRWFLSQPGTSRASLVFAVTWISTGCMFALEAGFAKEYLQATDTQVGLLFSLATVGSFIGVGYLLRSRLEKEGRLLTMACLLEIAFVAGYALAPSFTVAAGFVVLYGVFLSLRQILVVTRIHQAVVQAEHGKAFGVHQSLTNACMLLGMAASGPASTWVSLRMVMLGACALSFVLIVLLVLKPVSVLAPSSDTA